MESRDWWVDAGYDGESEQGKCRCAEQTDGWSLAGPETAPASAPKCVVPLTSPEGRFRAATKVALRVLLWGRRGRFSSVPGTRLRCERREAAGIWISTT